MENGEKTKTSFKFEKINKILKKVQFSYGNA